jgi:hypothetical protein
VGSELCRDSILDIEILLPVHFFLDRSGSTTFFVNYTKNWAFRALAYDAWLVECAEATASSAAILQRTRSTNMARGYALIVGVSQPGPNSGWSAKALPGVGPDCRNMEQFLKKDCGFQVDVLQDTRATQAAVLSKIGEAKDSLKRGDFFVFYYSGHGGQVDDRDGDESDRKDEVLLIYDRPIVDDQLAELWKGFPEGVRILTLMDACHSGTMVRKATSRGERTEIVCSPVRPLMLGLNKAEKTDVFRSSGGDDSGIQASLIHLSGCTDAQAAADTGQGGAFTLALLRTMSPPPPRDYDQLHAGIVRHLSNRPQVSEMHLFGRWTDEFRKLAPFKIDLTSSALVTATQETASAALAALGLRASGDAVETSSTRGILLSRPTRHRLDLVLDGNSITDVRARAYVLGMFEGVTPGGPAGAIDQQLGGAIREFVARRLFSLKSGEVFMLPTGNAPIPADLVLFAGLGSLDQFHAAPRDCQQLVASNVIRTMIRMGIDEFATVLVGGGSGQSVRQTLENLMLGFADGLRDADPGDRVRRVILCENDRQRYAEMVDSVYALGRGQPFEDISVTIYERPPLPPRPCAERAAPSVATLRSRMFLQVRHQQQDDANRFEAVLLTAGGKATAITSSVAYDPDDRNALLRHLGTSKFDVEKFGSELAAFALDSQFVETLGGPLADGQHLVVVHDAEASKLPWETLRCGDRSLALDGGISRKYLLTGDYSIAKWLERRRFDATLDILLVINPTEDLEGAECEGEIIRKMVQHVPNVKVTEVRGRAATRERLLREFRSGNYDVIHYAGHASFDASSPGRSGLLCADHRTLSGDDLMTLADLPVLVFFNACESGRVRKAPKAVDRLRESVSFAEAFLRGGIANFIGTYWPVGDASAEAFAKEFYGEIVKGRAIGDALLAGRRIVEKTGSYDWATYIHYGDPDFRIKEAGGPS